MQRATGQRRTAQQAISVAIVSVAMLAALPDASTAAAFPTHARSASVVTDGAHEAALITAGGTQVAVYDVHTRRTVGVPVTLPTDAGAALPRFFQPIGVFDGKVVLTATNPVRPVDGGFIDHLALVDARTGTFRWLCGEPDAPGAAPRPCPSYDPDGTGITDAVFQYSSAGSHWMGIENRPYGLGLLKWKLAADGAFSWRLATTAEKRRVRAAGTSAIDLDSSRAADNTKWGYTRRVAIGSSATTVRLRRGNDRRDATLTLREHSGDRGSVGTTYGSLGMAAQRGNQIIAWDRASRRVWTRTVRASAYKKNATCSIAGRTFVLSGFNDQDLNAGPLDWSIRWPSGSHPDGWRRVGTLRAGGRLTVR